MITNSSKSERDRWSSEVVSKCERAKGWWENKVSEQRENKTSTHINKHETHYLLKRERWIQKELNPLLTCAEKCASVWTARLVLLSDLTDHGAAHQVKKQSLLNKIYCWGSKKNSLVFYCNPVFLCIHDIERETENWKANLSPSWQWGRSQLPIFSGDTPRLKNPHACIKMSLILFKHLLNSFSNQMTLVQVAKSLLVCTAS